MNLSRFSVHRPIFVTMVVLMVLILGGVALLRLPIDLMPDITYPTLSISTSYSNASPEEMEELITRPIEEALSAVPGVTEVSSRSSEGSSNVRITFAWGTDLDAASNDVRDRLDRVIARLPDDADRPVLRKFDIAAFPILILGASSHLDPVAFRQLIEDEVKYRIESVPGVASLDIWGGQVREIHVNLQAEKLKALALPLDQVIARIKAANITLPAGFVDRGNYELTIRVPGEYRSIEEIADTVVAVRDGATIPLREVASVEDSWERVRELVRVNGSPGLRLGINKQSGTNTVQVARRCLAEIDAINEDLPQIKIIPIIDTSSYIQNSIRNVGASAVYGGCLAVIVLLLFLRNLRSTAVIAAAIPLSIVATFMLMYFGGFTLNLMTLGGLALGVGMMVDNSIVVLENIQRLHDTGMDGESAALHGSDEVTSAIVASTLTTVVVFLPLLFVRGMAGIMFKQLAMVIGFSLLCSLAVATTLVPMLASRLHGKGNARKERHPTAHRLYVASGQVLDRMDLAYRDLLALALRHRGIVLLLVLGLLGGSLALAPLVGVELMPATDEGEVRVTIEREVGSRFALTDDTMKRVEALVKGAVPEATDMVASVGAGGPGGGMGASGAHTGQMRIALVPRAQRTRSSEEIANALRPKLANIPGAVVRTRAGQGLFILRMGFGGTERVQVEIRGHDFATAEALGREVRAIVEGVEGVTDVQLSREAGAPEALIHIDRHKAADLKLTVSQIAAALETCLAGSSAGNFREEGDEYRILVQLEDSQSASLRDILDLTLTNSDGQPVVLRNVVGIEERSGPTRIERKNQQRVLTVSANVTDRDIGSVLADIRARLHGLSMPRGFTIAFGGDYEDQQEAFRELLLSLVLSLVLVYMVMACQFESLRDPFVVMFSVPLAAIGVILMLFLSHTTFNVQSFIGCIMLGGIVVNNAILLVDHTNLLRRRDGLPLREAVAEAGRRRLRPIMMTGLTTILALVPLAVGLGEGSEAQAPLARAVIGGLLSASLITLLVVPVVYTFFERSDPRAATETAPHA